MLRRFMIFGGGNCWLLYLLLCLSIDCVGTKQQNCPKTNFWPSHKLMPGVRTFFVQNIIKYSLQSSSRVVIDDRRKWDAV